MATKFASILAQTGSAVLKRRADLVNDYAAEAQADLVRTLKSELRDVELEVKNLEDMSVRSTDSLVVGEKFDAKQWCARMQELGIQKRNISIQLEVALATQETYFTEVSE